MPLYLLNKYVDLLVGIFFLTKQFSELANFSAITQLKDCQTSVVAFSDSNWARNQAYTTLLV